MNSTEANAFANAWVNAWNSHTLDAIMQHYADDIEFHSPLIVLLKYNSTGVIKGKSDLRQYFSIGLTNYPHLHFTLHECLLGVHTLVVYYTSVNNRKVAEVFELNSKGHAVKVYCNYNQLPPQ